MVSAQEQNLQFDGNGNLESGDGYCRFYDGFNQLTRVYLGNSCTGNPIETYTWHPIEERILIRHRYYTNGSLKETILYISKDYVRIENASGNYSEEYVWQNGALVAFIDTNGNKRFVHADHLGSSSVVTDTNGNVVETTFYSPFGEIIEGGKVTRYDYTGKEFLEGLNEFDFNARRYRADLARFTQPDTKIQNFYDPQLLNRYAYARNNPYKYVDPSGHVIVGFEGASQSSGSEISGVDEIAQAIQTEDSSIPIHVFSQDDVDAAKLYVEQQIEDNPNQPIVIYGHSKGGEATMQLAKALGKEGLSVDAAFTIDSFGYGDGKKPDNVGKLTNFQQKNSLFLKGETIKGAKNIVVTNKQSLHTTIDSNKKVQDRIVKNAVKVHQNYKDTKVVQKTTSFVKKVRNYFSSRSKK